MSVSEACASCEYPLYPPYVAMPDCDHYVHSACNTNSWCPACFTSIEVAPAPVLSTAEKIAEFVKQEDKIPTSLEFEDATPTVEALKKSMEEAIANENLKEMSLLIKLGVSVDEAFEHAIALSKDAPAVKLLMRGADYKKNPQLMSIAIGKGLHLVVQFLYKEGICFGRSALDQAVITQNVKMLKYILHRGGKEYIDVFTQNATPLYLAVSLGLPDITKLLVEEGADVSLLYGGMHIISVAKLLCDATEKRLAQLPLDSQEFAQCQSEYSKRAEIALYLPGLFLHKKKYGMSQ